MHYLFLCRSLTSAQKAARILQNEGIYAAVTKAPQSANPGGCTYGVKLAARYVTAAAFALNQADFPIRKVFEVEGQSLREVRL